MTNQLDDIDLKILTILMKDAKTPFSEIAKTLFVSNGTVHVRMKKMEDLGIIKSFNLQLNHHKIGYDITAFLGIYLSKSSQYDEVAKALEKIPEIVDLHYTTGNYSMFLKLICKDTEHLRKILMEKIQNIPEITRTETMISLQENINRPLDFEV
ncbi:MAG TPA: Lrp/AsnC ligand binding domain-containing protein [Chitinophagales bacterium]|nr:Lrp/AsnC ligand binding domain-containing protein [Chitinophagales bacterium]MBP6154734.1 Lrp/AsnC ligand binding domain-containing protein [Chitinophagales bacterium]HQV77361.1 Lrp/AsnC ligand binding domain-containing protein [Chitinophagales bacterium]HQW78423.1 Lrp/AsnC ligand binding domain-containing protein [Chitinophagales bacterium]HRB19736.1 Lrp/AsnC ligand binding domain-containing protein [Chitinophagales bacterium]